MAIVMTDQQIKQYVDNVFEKYDKDKSYTLDIKELSEYLNDLMLSRGSISLVSVEQVKNSMRVLNPRGDEMTKQIFYNSLQKINGSVDDIVVGIIQTMHQQEKLQQVVNNPGLKMTKSYIPAINNIVENKISQPPQIQQLQNIANQGLSRYQILPDQIQATSQNVVNTPQPFQAQPVRHQSTPMPYTNHHPFTSTQNLTKTIPTYPQQQSHYYQQQQQLNYSQQPTYRPQYSSSGYQSARTYAQQNQYGINMNNYGGAMNSMNSYGMGMSIGNVGGMGNMDVGAPVPPFNPLAALSFF